MALHHLSGWSKPAHAAVSSACGSACGASGKPDPKPAACGAADQPDPKPAACGSACGAGDKK